MHHHYLQACFLKARALWVQLEKARYCLQGLPLGDTSRRLGAALQGSSRLLRLLKGILFACMLFELRAGEPSQYKVGSLPHCNRTQPDRTVKTNLGVPLTGSGTIETYI